jgi:hypothetical protein
MCVRIRFSSSHTARIYDADSGTITLPSSATTAHRVTALRAVLSKLHVVQPEFGAICWCGETVDLTPRVPKQRRSEQVVDHGA